MTDKYCTSVFKVGASDYAAAQLRRLALRFVWLPAAILGACAAAGLLLADSRWIFVCLILLFVVYPMLASLVWLSATASREASMLLRPQRWTVDSDGNVEITFYTFSWPEEEVAAGSRRIDAADLRAVHASDSMVKVLTASTKASGGILLIPADILPAEAVEAMRRAIDLASPDLA